MHNTHTLSPLLLSGCSAPQQALQARLLADIEQLCTAEALMAAVPGVANLQPYFRLLDGALGVHAQLPEVLCGVSLEVLVSFWLALAEYAQVGG